MVPGLLGAMIFSVRDCPISVFSDGWGTSGYQRQRLVVPDSEQQAFQGERG